MAETAAIAAAFMLIFLIAAAILFLRDHADDIDVGRAVRGSIVALIKAASAVRGILIRFLIVYFVYIGVVFPFVSRNKEEAVWVVGLPFALAVAYLWGRLKQRHV